MNKPVRIRYGRAFLGLLQRDLRVLRRELGAFAVRVLMQPLLFFFVFTFLLPRIGQTSAAAGANFATVLLPGMMAVAIMFTGISAVALPLATEFGVTREIDDRVMCPLPVAMVAMEKVCFSAMQSILAALLVLPLALIIPSTPVHIHVANWMMLISMLVLASLVAGSMGLSIGTYVKPQQIGLIFSIIVMPIVFLGCVYYPWAMLGKIRWLQIAVLVNPIVYMSEGLRTALTPQVPHMNPIAIFAALLLFLAGLARLGIHGFLRRVLS